MAKKQVKAPAKNAGSGAKRAPAKKAAPKKPGGAGAKAGPKKAAPAKRAAPKKPGGAGSKGRAKPPPVPDLSGDTGIVIVDDDITVDQDRINEERRAYLEEARSQEASSD